jgi:hypothetical protein
MLRNLRVKGFIVTETEGQGDGETWYSVADQDGKLEGMYYIQIGE